MRAKRGTYTHPASAANHLMNIRACASTNGCFHRPTVLLASRAAPPATVASGGGGIRRPTQLVRGLPIPYSSVRESACPICFFAREIDGCGLPSAAFGKAKQNVCALSSFSSEMTTLAYRYSQSHHFWRRPTSCQHHPCPLHDFERQQLSLHVVLVVLRHRSLAVQWHHHQRPAV